MNVLLLEGLNLLLVLLPLQRIVGAIRCMALVVAIKVYL